MTEQPPGEPTPEVVISTIHARLKRLDPRIEDVDRRLVGIEARLPQSNIISQSFWSRAFAILGHQLAITLVIYAVIFGIAIAFGILGALLSPR